MHSFARKLFTPLALTTLAGLSAFIAPAETLACSPPAPAVTSTIPADGSYYPANGIVLVNGFDLSLDQVTVTVDGAPASLVDASGSLPGYVAPIAVRIEPKPAADQQVVISGVFCQNCASQTISFTTRPDDGAPPDGIVNARYGVHDYADFQSSGGDCHISSDLGLWLHAQPVPASEEETPSVLFVEVFADEALTKQIGSTSSVITSNNYVWGYRVMTETLQGTAPQDVCFRLKTADLAGNADPDGFVVCNACYSRTDPQTTSTGFPPAEPEWSDADTIAGGPCDWSIGVGGEPEPDGGCSCRTSSNSSSSAALLVLGLGGLVAARKRARRTRK